MTDLPFDELIETKVQVRLISEMEKESLITMYMVLADRETVDSINEITMTGTEFIYQT